MRMTSRVGTSEVTVRIEGKYASLSCYHHFSFPVDMIGLAEVLNSLVRGV